MIDPSNVPSVEDTEVLSRYVLQSRHFRHDKTPRPELFMPHPYQDLSVTRHRDATENELALKIAASKSISKLISPP